MKKVLVMLMAIAPCFAESDLIFPWVTNSSFQSQLVINNPNAEPVTVSLTATRQAGNDPAGETVSNIEIAPLAQWSQSAADLFPQLGEGGYMVRLTSDADNIQGGFVVRAGSSPAQANVVASSDTASTLLFNYLPAAESGAAAPVVINMGTETARVTYYAFKDGQDVQTFGEPRPSREIPPNHPHAELVSDLFPNIKGDLMIFAQSDQPMIGVAFLFNQQGEPSMANAVAADEVPGETFAIAPIYPVRSSGESWLLWELVVQNRTLFAKEISKLEIFEGETLLETRAGNVLTNDSFPNTLEIVGGTFNVLYLDLQVEPDAIPSKLLNRITFTDGSVQEYKIPVYQEEPMVIGPPILGAGWIAANALSNDNPHRLAFLVEEGNFWVPQRYAVDWVQLNAQGATHTGDGVLNSDYITYGQDLLAVGDGEVIRVRDGIEENTPPGLPDGITLDTVVGNFIVIDLGNNRFATYAHCQKDSIRVAVGDRVSRGDVIAKIGNNGNSTEAHLHFHFTDSDPGPTGLISRGLPYVFDSYQNAEGVTIENELPLDFTLVNFPEE